MALTECNECGKEISTRAVICPHCGINGLRARGVDTLQRMSGVLVFVICLGALIFTSQPGNPSNEFFSFITIFGMVIGISVMAAKSRKSGGNGVTEEKNN